MTSERHVQVLGFAGSLRRGSFNAALLRAAQEVPPEGMSIEIFDLAPIPLFNQDLEAEGDPDPVRQLKEKIAAADALLIATPEYNASFSGVMKNAIDWASRPAGKSVLNGKPAAILGASSGSLGTARAQMHLRQTAAFTNLLVLSKPELLVMKAQDLFDAELRLTDEGTRKRLRSLLDALVAWTIRLREAP